MISTLKGVLGLGCDAGGRAGELEDTERAREVSETTTRRTATPKKSNKGKRKRLRKLLAGCNGSNSSSSDAIGHQECMSDERSKKRRKLVSAGAKSAATTSGGVNTNSGEYLPADIWAKALAYLPYLDVLQCTVVNHAFLRRVAPLVERITVFSSSELKTRPAARFSGVKYAKIACLLRFSHEFKGRKRPTHDDDDDDDDSGIPDSDISEEEDYANNEGQTNNTMYGDVTVLKMAYEVDPDCTELIVPFLCQFYSLERAWIGGYLSKLQLAQTVSYDVNPDPEAFAEVADLSEYMVSDELEDELFSMDEIKGIELLRSMEHALFGAIRSRAFWHSVHIDGLPRCKNADLEHESYSWDYCRRCAAYCLCMPVDQVLDCHFFDADPCLCPPNRWIIKTILDRPGGRKYISSHDFMLKFLRTWEFSEKFAYLFELFDIHPEITHDEAKEAVKYQRGHRMVDQIQPWLDDGIPFSLYCLLGKERSNTCKK